MAKFTHLHFYYLHLNTEQKKEFKKKVIEFAKVTTKRSFFNYLNSEPKPHVKIFISQLTNIDENTLYKTINSIDLLTLKTVKL